MNALLRFRASHKLETNTSRVNGASDSFLNEPQGLFRWVYGNIIAVSQQKKLADMHYRVVKTLGAGAGSTIFLVTDTKLGRNFALKVVKRQTPDDDVYISQAVHEFEVAERLNHRNLLKIHDCRMRKRWFRTEGVELLLEYVDGRNLDELQGRELGQLTLIFTQTASGLAHMHRRGVYHGDVKPGNVMLSRAGQVKIIDFGTAWIKGEPKNRVQGTPQYMAPEQANERLVDDRTDIYNFGATMFRMFTGQYANLDIPGMANPAVMGRARRVSPMSIRTDMPGTLSELIVACLAENPDHRPSNFHEIKDKLAAVVRYLGLIDDDLRGSEEGPPEDED
jgi:serine/threonine-protein kinase